ncbi:MAG: hypothetical protein WD154_02710 [Nitrosopumilaceae archaeon]
MNKKIIAAIFGGVIAILSLVIHANLNTIDQNILDQTFVISAVYFENDGYAEISFLDKSGKTKHVTLEILGMPESFHKEYTSTTFVEKIQLSVPKYGWQSIPITLSVEHEEFGNIGIKTEIRPIGEAKAKIIFSKLDV